ncbi:MAG: hypothetical protein AUI33_05805, partial [Ignavibacteria bacterium 13_1_40CM_2_61_4]
MKLGFAHPELAPLGVAALLLLALGVATLIRRRRASVAFAGRGSALVSVRPAALVAKLGLLAIASLALAIAMVGPQIGETPRRAASAPVDTMIALDVSQSMGVKDVPPDRLHVAREAIEVLGAQLAGGRVGLTLFAGTSALRYPLTADTRIVGPALDTSGRGFKIAPGSALRAALVGASGQFPTDAANEARAKAIVIISDGEDPAPDLPPLGPLLQRNIRVFALGVGTSEGGPVPLYDQKGQLQQMLVDANGTQVTSRLDEARLRSLAEQGGGRYLRYEGAASAREIADALRAMDAGVAPAEAGVSPENRYQIFLGIAVLALLAGWLIDERRPMPWPRTPRVRP